MKKKTTGTAGAPQFISTAESEPVQRLLRILSSDASEALGDSVLARDWAGQAANLIEMGRPLPENLRKFISTALTGIAEGKDPAQAFGIKKGSRRKHSPLFECGLVSMVDDAVSIGGTLDDAYLLVADALKDPVNKDLYKPYPIGKEAVRKLYSKLKSGKKAP